MSEQFRDTKVLNHLSALVRHYIVKIEAIANVFCLIKEDTETFEHPHNLNCETGYNLSRVWSLALRFHLSHVVPSRWIAPHSTPPPLFQLLDLYIRPHPPPSLFTSTMATAMYARTLEQLQHMMWLDPGRWNYTFDIGHENQRREK
jgi:hypothetical protein